MRVDELISKYNQDYSTYYQHELYSHTSMVLPSLQELGTSDERIEEYFEKDIKKLLPINTNEFEITDGNWKKHLGDLSYETPYNRYFFSLIENHGYEKVIGDYFDFLIEGVGAAAFHPMIRLYYAVKRKDNVEIAYALGTWASSDLDLGINNKLEGSKSIKETLVDFKYFNNGKKVTGKNIAYRMQNVSKIEEFQYLCKQVNIKNIGKEKVKESLLWLYSQTNNFTLLHAITSHHSFESLNHFSKDQTSSRIFYWKSVLAAYLSTTGDVSINFDWTYPEVELKEWYELKRLAIAHQDNHVIKLVHTLSEKNINRLDRELRFAASLKLGILN